MKCAYCGKIIPEQQNVIAEIRKIVHPRDIPKRENITGKVVIDLHFCSKRCKSKARENLIKAKLIKEDSWC